MSNYDYELGLQRGREGKRTPEPAFEFVDPRRDKEDVQRGWEAGRNARAVAEEIQARRKPSNTDYSYTSSESNPADFFAVSALACGLVGLLVNIFACSYVSFERATELGMGVFIGGSLIFWTFRFSKPENRTVRMVFGALGRGFLVFIGYVFVWGLIVQAVCCVFFPKEITGLNG